MRSTSNEFAEAVTNLVPGLRYRPARKDGIAVRQLVTFERELTASVEQRSIERR
jgi:hypothetical protein